MLSLLSYISLSSPYIFFFILCSTFVVAAIVHHDQDRNHDLDLDLDLDHLGLQPGNSSRPKLSHAGKALHPFS